MGGTFFFIFFTTTTTTTTLIYQLYIKIFMTKIRIQLMVSELFVKRLMDSPDYAGNIGQTILHYTVLGLKSQEGKEGDSSDSD